MGEQAGDIRIRVLGWIHVVLGGGCLAIGLFVCAKLAEQPDDKALYYVGPIFLFLSAIYFVPSLIGGWGLIKGHRWARVFIGLLSVLLLLAIPIGTLLGGFGLWALVTGKPPAPPAKPVVEPAAQRGEVKRVTGVLAMMALVGLGFIVFLGAGFKISGDAAPAGLMGLFWPALVLFLALLVYLVVKRPFAQDPGSRFENPFETFALRQAGRRQTKAAVSEYDARLAHLDADPIRRGYAARMRMGEWWSDEHIAYDLDRERLDTCVHLQPIERAMREAGLTVKPIADGAVDCDCRVDEPGLIARFGPAPGVSYREYFRGGISVHDFPTAQIDCQADRSSIVVVHGLEARAGTAWFPAPPTGA